MWLQFQHFKLNKGTEQKCTHAEQQLFKAIKAVLHKYKSSHLSSWPWLHHLSLIPLVPVFWGTWTHQSSTFLGLTVCVTSLLFTDPIFSCGGKGRQYVRVHVCVCVCVFGGGGGTVHNFLFVPQFIRVCTWRKIYLNSVFFSLCSLKEKTALEQNLHIVTCYPLMVIASRDIRRFVLDSCSTTVKPLKMYDSNSFWGHFVACPVAKNLLLLRISISNSKSFLSFCSFFKVPENQTLSIVSNCYLSLFLLLQSDCLR